jgi:hypothetical protein
MYLSMTPRSSDDASTSPSHVPDDGLRRWFVVTPFGHSVFVEDEVKACALRKTYDAPGYCGSSVMSELLEEDEQLIPF